MSHEIKLALQFTTGFIALIPSIALMRHYRRTGIVDYLIFSSFFAMAVLDRVFVLTEIENQIAAEESLSVLYLQIHWIILETATILLFLHAVRIRWRKTPPLIWYTGIVWYVFIIISILFWERIDESEREVVLFIEMSYTYNFDEAGVGLMTSDGVIVTSSAHLILGVLLGIYVGFIVLYAYYKVDLVTNDSKSILARRFWIISSCLWLIVHFWALPWDLYHEYVNLLFLISLVLVCYISIFIPEAMLLSKIQIMRAVNLYQTVLKLQTESEKKEFGMVSLVEYLQNLPPDVISADFE